MTTSLAPIRTLANGVAIPRLGFGTWPMPGDEAARAVTSAIDLGYRLIDTAENYENEDAVGQGIRDSGVPRDEIFLTTKFNKKWHSVAGAQEACETSLKRLGMDYIDLLLIHWPNPDQGTYVEAFEGLSNLLDAGKVRSIGVCNFKTHHLDELFKAGFMPHVNQIQLDPYVRRDDVVAACEDKGIVVESWSPIGRGGDLLSDPAVLAVAETHGKTPGQVVLRWQLQSDYLPIPKSANPTRQAENLDVFDFELTLEDLTALNGLGRDISGILDSDVFGH